MSATAPAAPEAPLKTGGGESPGGQQRLLKFLSAQTPLVYLIFLATMLLTGAVSLARGLSRALPITVEQLL
jgi:hypothetical protein